MTRRTQSRIVLPLVIACLAVVGLIWFPLFHIVPLKKAAAEEAAVTFDPAKFAQIFWTNQLLPAVAKAVPAKKLLSAIETNAAAAKTNYSRSLGLDESYFYFLIGTGRVTEVSNDEVSLNVTGHDTNAEISLQTSLIFGNALRDGTGLLNVNDYPNSQDFNGISEALNHIVETRVLPELHQQAKIGSTISFAGCAEVDDASTDLKPLKVIPIETQTK